MTAGTAQGPMTAQEILRVLRRRWLVLLVAVIVGLAGGGAAWYLVPSTYGTTLTLYVSAQTSDSTQLAYQGSLLSQERVKSYVQLVGSTRVSGEVARELGLDLTPEELAQQISASAPTGSALINLKVTAESPQLAADIANTTALVFTGLIDELEAPVIAGEVQPVAVRVVQPAAVPTEPSSTELPQLLTIGALLALALAVGSVLARHALSTSIDSAEALGDAAAAPNIASIPYVPRPGRQPIVVDPRSSAPSAEAYRRLRANVLALDTGGPSKVITVTSAANASGTTTTVANLAHALDGIGRRVLLIDADLRQPKIAQLLELDDSVGLTNVLAGEDPARARQPGPGRMDVITAGQPPANPGDLLAGPRLTMVLTELRHRYDVVLIDTPALGPVGDAAVVASASDGVLLVCRYGKAKRHEIVDAVVTLDAVSAPVLATILTMTPKSLRTQQYRNSGRRTGPTHIGPGRPWAMPVDAAVRAPGHPGNRANHAQGVRPRPGPNGSAGPDERTGRTLPAAPPDPNHG